MLSDWSDDEVDSCKLIGIQKSICKRFSVLHSEIDEITASRIPDPESIDLNLYSLSAAWNSYSVRAQALSSTISHTYCFAATTLLVPRRICIFKLIAPLRLMCGY